MTGKTLPAAAVLLLAFCSGAALNAAAAKAPKVHRVGLGLVKKVSYSRLGDPAGAREGESTLEVRPLVVDGQVKEWTTGSPHDITDRSFVVRRALRVNDALPGPVDGTAATQKDRSSDWVWQRGPWLLVDRASGHITALHLPDYDPTASDPVWFRDYAAYCGVAANGKSLYAVVAQLAARKPVLAKKISAYSVASHPSPVCAPVEWQREPLRVTFHATNAEPASFDLAGSSALLVEDNEDDSGPAVQAAPPL